MLLSIKKVKRSPITLWFFSCLLFSINTMAADCSNLSDATELTAHCATYTPTKKSSPKTCTLKANITYKITQDSGSIATPLPPVSIPASSALCISNDSLSGEIALVASSFKVEGLFQIGSATDPISSSKKVTVTMTGTNSASHAPEPICISDKSKCSTIATTTINADNARDITVMGSGKLLFFGKKGLTKVSGSTGKFVHDIDYASGTVDGTSISSVSNNIDALPYINRISGSNSWTYLNKPSGPAYFSETLNVQSPVTTTNFPTTLGGVIVTTEHLPYLMSLSRNVQGGDGTDWEAGDWISVSTTTFVEHETEIVQICAIFSQTNPDSLDTATPTTSILVLAGANGFTSQCSTVSSNTPLKNYHFGSLAPTSGFFSQNESSYKGQYDAIKGQAKSFYDGADRNFGIDERAEVALLSRNIKLTSTSGVKSINTIKGINDQYFGGHIAIMNMSGTDAPTATIQLVGVEIEKFGQPLVGRYPIHFHRLNADSTTTDTNPLLVQDTSIHHSFNKCFVTHDTIGVNFYNNSCVRTIGQGFYLEDGFNISGNQYIRNLVAGTMAASLIYDTSDKTLKDSGGTPMGKSTYWQGDYLAVSNFRYNPEKVPDTSDSGANTGNFIDSFEPSGFWITSYGQRFPKPNETNEFVNKPNVFVNNSVAGCQLRGAAYWAILQDIDNIDNVPYADSNATLYPVFTGNRGHACYDGFIAGNNSMVKVGSNSESIGPQPLPVPIGEAVSKSAKTPFVIFDNLNFTQIQHKAFWYRGVFIGVNNSRFAALKQGMTLLGGGGPEGNLLGFWGLVHNSVFAGVTNNNVGRYTDCEGYYEAYGTGGKTLSADNALPLNNSNEMAKCTPYNLTESISDVKDAPANPIGLFGDIYQNFNFQGYTFYDGPARMENNRFVNFRADVTDPALYENDSDSYSQTKTRHLVTKIDAHRMMNYNNASQLSTGFTGGGKEHYGTIGDPAFSWLKGNAQSVPPTQYAKGNLWDNVNYKHQVFTDIVNLSQGLKDGDKQTVEIDRDGTLSGYKICESKSGNTSICSDNGLNHFPISLNNLNVFGTKSTVDEPHSQGRNSVISSALMSPHKYATVNLEVNKENDISGLNVTRDMSAYSTPATTNYEGRGGKAYIYETMAMNNMGYSYDSDNLNGSTAFLISYSDAPVDTTFINRVGFHIGKGMKNIQLFKVGRQWNSGVNYLAKSPYWSGYGLTDTTSICPTIFSDSDAYAECSANGTSLSNYSSFEKLNTQFFNVINNNYNASATQTSDFTEGYYYDECAGVLYFNMVQFAQPIPAPDTELPRPITPPYGTCDSTRFSGASSDIQGYLALSNPDSLSSILEVGCYAESGTPVTSELLTCPTQGCAVYAFSFETGGTPPSSNCSAKSNTIIDGGAAAPSQSGSQITYGSPYQLYDVSESSPLTITPASITVNSSLTRSYNYDTGTQVPSSPTTSPPLPMPPAPSTQNGKNYALNSNPSDVNILVYGGPSWTLTTGSSASAGQAASISAIGGHELHRSQPSQKSAKTLNINPASPGNNIVFKYAGETATVNIGTHACIITFGSSSLSAGTGSGCSLLTASGTTIKVKAPQIWSFTTGASVTAGQAASISASSGKFSQLSPSKKTTTPLRITPASPGNNLTFLYTGKTATVKIGSQSCTITFGTSSLSAGKDAGCSLLTLNGTTISVNAPQIWTFNTGASPSAGQNAAISTVGSKKFTTTPAGNEKTCLSIAAASTGNSANYLYAGTSAKVTFGNSGCATCSTKGTCSNSCTINFDATSLSKGSEPGCAKIIASGVTITVQH